MRIIGKGMEPLMKNTKIGIFLTGKNGKKATPKVNLDEMAKEFKKAMKK